MSSKVVLEVGEIYNRLTVTGRHKTDKSGSYLWECECQCEGKKSVWAKSWDLKKGNTKSCGCLRAERRKEFKNGGYRSLYPQFYQSWESMKQRCLNENFKHYDNYGGRGITVCKEWMNINGFAEDMLSSWKEDLTIDRIDNDKGYYRDNCRWATRAEQSSNRSNSIHITINGETKQISEWTELSDVPAPTIYRRYKAGIEGEALLIQNKQSVAERQSGVKYITWNKKNSKWRIIIKHDGKRNYLGQFDDLNEAKTALSDYKKDLGMV